MGKRLSSRRIKSHRCYTYEQTANVLGVTPQTVRGWRSLGLTVLTDKIPHLIIGEHLIAYLDTRNSGRRIRLALDQFRCMHCGGAVRAYGAMADYSPLTTSRGVLRALCATCEGNCTKFVSRAQMVTLSQTLSIAKRNE